MLSWWTVHGAASLENGPAISQNAKHKLPYNQTILFLVSIPKGTGNVFMQKTCTFMFARGLFIMSPMETVFMPITWWMNKGSMCTHDEITFYKWQQSTNMCYNLARPWKSYAEWKKPVKRPQIVSLHLCEMLKVGKSRKMKSRLVIFQPFEEKWGVTVKWCQVSFWGRKNILRIRWWQCWAALGIH